MKQRIQNMNVKNKTVLLRVDYNVPLEGTKVLDDTKIKSSLETIEYLLKENCKIILLSHLGKIKSESDKTRYTLEPIANKLKELLKKEVYFSKVNFGPEVIKRVKELKPKEILMLENTRFLDLPQKLESKCDPQVSEFWASLGDIFINDAFGSTHRRHASTYGISEFLPSGIGFLIQKEIEMLEKNVIHAERPFTLIMGGAKLDDKIGLIEALLPKCDHLLLGGGIANTFLETLGFKIGESLTSESKEIKSKVKELLLKNKEKIKLPLDAIVGSTYDKNYIAYKLINKIEDNEMILDISAKTIEEYAPIINESKTIFLNGAVGLYENPKFANGTKELFELLKKSKAKVIVGGGDAVSSVKNLGYQKMPEFISTGGGATLEFLATQKLPALDAIKDEIETLKLDE